MERHRFRVFENKLLMRISGPKREAVRGGQGKLLNEELNNLHSPQVIIRIMTSRRTKEVGYAACTEEIKNTCRLRCRKLEGKTSLGRSRNT